MKKVGRNDLCPCGSGKKFKKCCEPKSIGGKFLAKKVEMGSPVTSLFNRVIVPIKPEIPAGETQPEEPKS